MKLKRNCKLSGGFSQQITKTETIFGKKDAEECNKTCIAALMHELCSFYSADLRGKSLEFHSTTYFHMRSQSLNKK